MGFISHVTSTDTRLPGSAVLLAGVMLAAGLLATGCGGNDGGNDSARPAAATPAPGESADTSALAEPATGTGTVSGTVKLLGDVPARKQLRMSADPYCVKANEAGAFSQSIVTGGQGGLAGVFVYLSAGVAPGSRAVPDEPVVLDQRGCMYEPRVVGVRVGQEIEFRNSDSTLHNVHAMPESSRSFNLGMPRKGMTTRRRFSKPEVLVRVKCDVHPWMEAYVGVLEHPYFAVTDEQGRYSISGLVPGDYTLAAVHPRLGRLERAAQLQAGDSPAGDAPAVDFAYPARGGG